MKSWNQRLIQLESRLQALIEGSAARLFPSQDEVNLPSRLVLAMKSTLQDGEEGEPLAPNLYLLKVHPAQAPNLMENPTALQDLALIIQQAGLEAGLRFNAPPVVKIFPDPRQSPHHLTVEARLTTSGLGQTKTFAQEILENKSNALPPNAFLIVEGSKIFPLDYPVVNIGRRVDNHLVIEDSRVSRLHAQLRAIKGQFFLFDLNSTGGTFINGKRIRKMALQPGDVISLAGVLFVFGQDPSTLSGDTHGSTRPIVPYPEEE
jgi:hypothetical protein